jgi:type II secretory pathway predicted ATPase ExeA/septal ring-binding cell division protein DamX
MYLSHFGLNEAPFRITPHTEFFFSGANRGATLEALLYAITHDEGIVKVTGEVGSGKTMLCRVLVERLPKSVETIYLANPSLSRDEILHVLATDLQVESRTERVTILLRALQERLIKLYAAGRRVVVLIDEAHAMPVETLEEVRLLSNLESNRHKLLQIVLFGQPELDEHLAAANMRQLKERITHSFRLEPLVRSDVESYIDFRMRAAGYRGPNVFASPAMRLITRASEGLTRRINILADKSLLAAFADGTHQVAAKHARAAIRDSELGGRRWRAPNAWWLAGAGVAVGLLASVGLHLYNQSRAAGVASGSPTAGIAPPAAPAPPSMPSQPSPAASAGSGAPAPGAAATPAHPPQPEARPVAEVAAPVAGVSPQTSGVGSTGPAATTGGDDAGPAVPPVQATPSPPPGPNPPASGKLTQERFAATQRWLRSAPSGSWTIQLMTSGDARAIERFLEQAGQEVRLEDLYIYSVKLHGRQYYGVTYGNYPSLEETITAMGDLPLDFKSRGPFHRSIPVMRRQNQE